MNDFILRSFIKDLTICDDLINFFNENPDKQKQGLNYSGKVNPEIKDSLDMSENSLHPDLISRYQQQLDGVIKEYIVKYPYAAQSPFGLIENFNIQYYKPGMGFHVWHCERSDITEPAVSRNLVWMTYLNDVNDGGETEFFHQKLKVKPVKGLTLIWPSDWTHTHRGLTSSEDKYIITGWLNHCDPTKSTEPISIVGDPLPTEYEKSI
jgi:hypothetical protein